MLFALVFKSSRVRDSIKFRLSSCSWSLEPGGGFEYSASFHAEAHISEFQLNIFLVSQPVAEKRDVAGAIVSDDKVM
jgi:hypothetical protein